MKVKNLFVPGDLRRDTLLRRLAIVSLAVTASFVGLAVALTALWIVPLCEKIRAAETLHRREIVHQAFLSQMDRLGDLTRTYAVWDDAYAFARGKDPAFTRDNFSAEALRQINVDAVLVLGAGDAILFETPSSHTRVDRRLMHSVLGAAAAAPGLATTDNGVRSGIVVAPGQAAFVTVARIRRSDGGGDSPGRIVFVRRIDEARVQHLEARTDTPLDLLVGERAQVAPPSGTSAYVAMDAYGRPAVALAYPIASPISGVAARALILIAAVTAAALAMTWLVMGMLLLRGVVRPVRALLREIDADASWEDGAKNYRHAPVEIIKLRAAFAQKSRALREENERERAATEDANRARSAAEIANRARAHFVGRVSHELRTPLHAIISYGEMLEESLARSGNAQDGSDLGRMMAAARRLLSHVNDLIDMARLESGRMPLARNTVDVAALIGGVADGVRPLADAERTRLVLDLDPDLGVVTSDHRRLAQCVDNLVSNAVKFAPGGEVRVMARRGRRRDDEAIIITVADNGAGMSAEQLDRAFQPFMQADEDGHLKNGGLGLGLTIVRGLVGILGGRLDAESEPGRGTRFRIVLPVEPAPPQALWGGAERSAA